MNTALSIELLQKKHISLPDLEIGQAIDIAQIPTAMNERRLSAFITHISNDPLLAGRLTAQERYYILISHQAVAQNRYSAVSDIDEYVTETIQHDVPAEHQVGDISINHLLGAHVCVLEGICQNVYDWLAGQVACQLSGDLNSIVGGYAEALNWDDLRADMTEAELNATIQARVATLNKLSVDNFNEIILTYNLGVSHLQHFVVLGCENNGLTIIKQGGDGIDEPARFLALSGLHGTAERLAECLAG